MARGVWVAAVIVLAGCGGGEEPAARTPAPTPVVTATPAPPEVPAAEEVTFRATDGEEVRGEYTAAASADAPAIVLLHELRGGVDRWEGFIPYLHEAGFAVLAYESRGSPVESDRLPDALGALRWVRRDADRVGLVGASVGASTTVLAMATGARRTVDAAVALSPPESPDIWKLQENDRYRPHDLLFVADEREAPASEEMLKGARRSELVRSPTPGHGIVLLGDPGIRESVLSWLRDRLG
jgi:pimeloyl-ACP methyl ester carboxylesterase